jgi:hypothetical protein
MAVENWHVGWFFCKLLVALTAAELPRRRQLNAVSRWLVVGPNPAMHDHRPLAATKRSALSSRTARPGGSGRCSGVSLRPPGVHLR